VGVDVRQGVFKPFARFEAEVEEVFAGGHGGKKLF